MLNIAYPCIVSEAVLKITKTASLVHILEAFQIVPALSSRVLVLEAKSLFDDYDIHLPCPQKRTIELSEPDVSSPHSCGRIFLNVCPNVMLSRHGSTELSL
jgi:hypothetical protein